MSDREKLLIALSHLHAWRMGVDIDQELLAGILETLVLAELARIEGALI